MASFIHSIVMAIGTRTGYWVEEDTDDEMVDAIAEAPRPDLMDGITLKYLPDGCVLEGTEGQISAVANHLGLPVNMAMKQALMLSCHQTLELLRHGISSFQKP